MASDTTSSLTNVFSSNRIFHTSSAGLVKCSFFRLLAEDRRTMGRKRALVGPDFTVRFCRRLGKDRLGPLMKLNELIGEAIGECGDMDALRIKETMETREVGPGVWMREREFNSGRDPSALRTPGNMAASISLVVSNLASR